MKTNLILKNKWFWGWDDVKEEAWLRQMANNGLHLVKIAGLARYAFQSGEPRDVVYRMDFYANSQGEYEHYLKLFRDAGWEFIGEFMSWQYFRKPSEQGEAPEILSDAESKIKKYQNLLTLLGISAALTLGSLILIIFSQVATPLILVIAVVLILLGGFYAFCFAGFLKRINQLKRM